MKMKCSGCGTEYEEDEIRFCRRDMGGHVCGSLIFPVEESKEIKPTRKSPGEPDESKGGQ